MLTNHRNNANLNQNTVTAQKSIYELCDVIKMTGFPGCTRK